ncbi:hypothetical protein M0813_15601 [Anaeramoeba flamelloides]|uniref:Cathepsin L n=1 Tax=Anaeramoeba flamelloides TaxID=1746091 RepID=A0ABQ8Z1R0_9EUKA|nr:hypothetical protein M0813_15601 [Anaeramoeba flamelloides]
MKLFIGLIFFLFCLQFFAVEAYPAAYKVKTVWQIPAGGIVEPLVINYDGNAKKQRISMYTWDFTKAIDTDLIDNGAKKAYHLRISDSEPKCFLDTEETDLHPVLPDLSTWTKLSNTVMRGWQVLHYQMNQTQYGRVNTYDFYCKDDTDKTPVRYHLHGSNILFGSHYDNYILDYYEYSTTLDSKVFDVPSLCSGDVEEKKITPQISTISASFKKFSTFASEFGKIYKTQEEHTYRQKVFQSNLEMIENHNAQNKGYKLGLNQFSDLTFEEFSSLKLGHKGSVQPGLGQSQYESLGLDVPDYWNWKERGAVAYVKDQCNCGSCWSFSGVGALEGAYYMAFGELKYFSEQNLMDCSWEYGNNACEGGLYFGAYDYIREYGLTTEDQYPYLNVDAYCGYDSSMAEVAITGYLNISTPGDEALLQEMLYINGPLAIAIDVLPDFVFYTEGVYNNDKCGNKFENLNHGVLLVGYGTENGDDYWLIKNSWSTTWGDQGYIKMIRNADNQCGIGTVPAAPIIDRNKTEKLRSK